MVEAVILMLSHRSLSVKEMYTLSLPPLIFLMLFFLTHSLPTSKLNPAFDAALRDLCGWCLLGWASVTDLVFPEIRCL